MVDEEATKNYEQSINYIVKMSRALSNVSLTVKNGETDVTDNRNVTIPEMGDNEAQEYYTARQDEDVTVKFKYTLGEGEALDALYYNETLGNAEGNVIAATQGQDGFFTATFKMGSATLDGVKVRGAVLLGIKKHTHSYDAGTITTPATCTAKGVKTFKCTVSGCNASKTEEIAALGHSYTSVVTAPTCTQQGYTTHTCSREGCNDSYVDTYVDALGHDYQGVGTAPTCTEPGSMTYTCGREGCNDSYTEKSEALGHDYQSVVTAPTCTEKGHTTYTCSRCKDSYTEEIAAKGHD